MSAAGWQPARRIAGFDRLFGRYLRWLLRRSFAEVRVRSTAAMLPDGGYVAVANHSSWWDGFAALLVHQHGRAPQPFAIMMDEAQLRRFPFFRWAGAFSVDARSPRAAHAAIAYAAAQAHAGSGVWIFPQGVLRAAHAPLAFTSGFAHAAEAAGVPVVPMGVRYAFGKRQRPQLWIDIGPPLRGPHRSLLPAAEAAVGKALAQIDDDLLHESNGEIYRPLMRGRLGVDDIVATVTATLTRR